MITETGVTEFLCKVMVYFLKNKKLPCFYLKSINNGNLWRAGKVMWIYSITPMTHKQTATHIIALKNADLALREELIAKHALGNGYNPEMANLHNQNAEKLAEIIDQIGYPTIDKVGKDANEAAWLIIQHAIERPDFMKKCAALLAEAVAENTASQTNLAYLTDRIAVFENKPQLYGTQFDWDENGILSPNVFDDLTKVNERRESIGLNTLEAQTAILRKQVAHENQTPPADFEQRKTEMELWKKNVGWIK